MFSSSPKYLNNNLSSFLSSETGKPDIFSTVLNQEQFQQKKEGKWQQAPSNFETTKTLHVM